MKAIVITRPGGSEVLEIRERPVPEPAGDEVLVKVMAAGLNRPDVAQRKGKYPAPPGAPADIPGLEIAGVIEKTGSNVADLRVGDKVCALVSGGGYAEYCLAPALQCLSVPENFTYAEAASLPETFFTVWSNVFDRAHFRNGETLLVHGGTSGIGVTAIQMIKAFGGTVYATAGTDEKCAVCESLGATRAINYNTDNFRDRILELTGQRGVDIILDMIGGPYTEPNLEILADDGRLVFINFMKGEQATIGLSRIMRKRLTITGSTLRARDVTFKGEIASKLREHVWPLLSSGVIRPVVFKTYPLQEAAAGHSLMESSNHIGKIVLTV
jgi:NADPH:quinone reductase